METDRHGGSVDRAVDDDEFSRRERCSRLGFDSGAVQRVHKAGREEIGAAYILALTKAVWKQTKKDLGSMDFYDFEKGSEKLSLNVYDFENTGVIIEKK